MTPADLKPLHKCMLDVEHIGIIYDEMRPVVEELWAELVHKLPPTNAVACAWFGGPPNTDIEKKAPGTCEAFKELTTLEKSRDQSAPDPLILSQGTNQARRGSRKRPDRRD
jgi:hypothetical protein